MRMQNIRFISSFFLFLYLVSCGQYSDHGVFNLDPTATDSSLVGREITWKEALGQIFLVRATDNCQFLQEIKPGGIVFWGADVQTEDSVRNRNLNMQRCLQSSGGMPLLTSTNHEGGRVHYFSSAAKVNHFASAQIQCQRGAQYVYQVSSAQATELAYAGMNMNLGPVADILTSSSNVIGDRAYGNSTRLATPCIEQAFLGYENHKMKAVLKHFPGHGGTSADTHSGFVIDNSSRSTIDSVHLNPYRRIFGSNASTSLVMTSHILYSSLDNSWPTTMSKKILVDLLRNELGFEGVVMTDSMTMGAILSQWSIEDASILSFMAGADMLMIQDQEAVRRIYMKLLEGVSRGIRLSVKNIQGQTQTFSFSAEQIKNQIMQSTNRIVKIKKSVQALDFDFLSRLTSTRQPDWAKHAQLGRLTAPMGEDPTARDP